MVVSADAFGFVVRVNDRVIPAFILFLARLVFLFPVFSVARSCLGILFYGVNEFATQCFAIRSDLIRFVECFGKCFVLDLETRDLLLQVRVLLFELGILLF